MKVCGFVSLLACFVFQLPSVYKVLLKTHMVILLVLSKYRIVTSSLHPNPVFVNKALLKRATHTHFPVRARGCFHTGMAVSTRRPCGPHRLRTPPLAVTESPPAAIRKGTESYVCGPL